METVKRLFISLLVLLGCTAGAWAIEQDSDGFYLIGSVQDWKDFAAVVATTNDAKAKMIADIDLGDDQTHIGSMAQNGTTYKGTFDGQGYTLTVAYVGGSRQIVAPFTNVQGATIKNLHVDGSISSVFAFIGVVGYVRGSGSVTTVSNVWNSATMSIQTGEWAQSGAIVGGFNNGSVVITDCLFTGSFTTNQGGYCGCFTGYTYSAGSITQTNCLSTGTFSMSGTGFRGTHSNCYVSSFPASFPSGVAEATAEGISDGTIATALGDGWAQDPLTHQPVPKIFTTVQDEDGNYLIGSVQDWKRFAAIVETTPNANAKMTADVDLGDDQTMVGTYHQKYQGTFDGQGHTLTFKYNTAGMSFEPEQRDLSLNFLGAAPFRDIEGATICNLHTAGSVTAEKIGASGLVGWTYGTNTIENCWSDVDIVSSNNTADTFAGFVAFQYGTQLNITDCVYTGKIQSASNISHAGFVAFQRYGKSSLNNCLLLLDEGSDVNTTTTQGLKYYTFVRNFESHNVANTINNCYYLTPFGVAQGTQITDGDISDGTTAAALQADRSEEIWVQDPVLGIPMLKIFATFQDEDGNYLIGSVQDWKRFADIVKTTPTANAKMVADVDLGDDQTMVGDAYYNNASMRVPFSGVFDGQGHTLTIHYVTANMPTSQRFFGGAPFGYVVNGTIRNLHTAGTLTSSHEGVSGMIGYADGNTLIENCRSSVNITFTASYGGAGFVYWSHSNSSILTLRDCIYDGTITGSQGYNSGLVVWYPNGECRIENSLVAATFNGSSYNCCTFIRPENSNHTITNSYYKNAVGAVQGTQATTEQLSDGTTATALQASRSEEIWVQDPVLGYPMLKIFAKTEEDNPVTDLSATTTANTYIVSAAGKYKFKATVKGNGGLDPLTGTIATPIDPASIAGVKVLWELGDTYGRAIKYEDSAYDISYSDGYVYFSTPNSFTTGVACVAIYDSSDNILWSWDIWSTPEPGTATYNGNTFMDRNLCAVDLNYNRGFLYQWGRKDAFSAATGSYASFTFVPALFTAFNTVRGIQTIDYCIKHPTTHVNNGDENSWMSREEYEKLPWRDDIKTIYDPCPAGWRVPTAAEQNGYSGLPGTGFSNAINEFGNPGSGYYRSSTISSYPRAYAFRQSGQQNNWGTNPAFAIRPVKEGIYFIYTVPASGLGTFSAAENVIIPAGLTAYYCTTLKTYEDGSLGIKVFRLNGIIPANTGVLLEGSPGLSYPLTATTVEAAAPAENSLVAVVESEHIPATNGEYTNFMMKVGKFIKIADESYTVKMPANHAYLPLLTEAISGSNAKEIMLYWDDEEATGIESLPSGPSPKGEGSIYNLNGQKLSAPQKGINIINGRKVIVK